MTSPNSPNGESSDTLDQAQITKQLRIALGNKSAQNDHFNEELKGYQAKVNVLRLNLQREFKGRRDVNVAEVAALTNLLVALNLVSVEDIGKINVIGEPAEHRDNASLTERIERCFQLSALSLKVPDLASVPQRSEEYYKQGRPDWLPLDDLLDLKFDVTADKNDVSKLEESYQFLKNLSLEGLLGNSAEIISLQVDLIYESKMRHRDNNVFNSLLINLLLHLKNNPQFFQIGRQQQQGLPTLLHEQPMLFGHPQLGGQVPMHPVSMTQFPIHPNPAIGIPPFFPQDQSETGSLSGNPFVRQPHH